MKFILEVEKVENGIEGCTYCCFDFATSDVCNKFCPGISTIWKCIKIEPIEEEPSNGAQIIDNILRPSNE